MRCSWMRRAMAYLSVCMLLLTLFGCSGDPQELSDFSSVASTAETTEITPTTTTTTTTVTPPINAPDLNAIIKPCFVGTTEKSILGERIAYKEIRDIDMQLVPEAPVEAGIIDSYDQLRGTDAAAALRQRYDESYFKDHALIVVSSHVIPAASLYDLDYNRIGELIVQDHVLYITAALKVPLPPDNVQDWPETVEQYNIVLEVTKKEIEQIQDIVVYRMMFTLN